jgi:hypothetical protein
MKKEGVFRVHGQIRTAWSRRELPGLTVQAIDRDLCFDDRLGMATTDAHGRFEIRYSGADFQDFFDLRPDLFLRVFGPEGELLHTTERNVRYEADDTEEFVIELPDRTVDIRDAATLRRRIVSDPALQQELAQSVSELLADKELLDPGLAYCLVPVVTDRPASEADLFPTALGPQPEPPDLPALRKAYGAGVWMNPQPEPPLPVWLHGDPGPRPGPARALPPARSGARERPPWWWWIGLPAPEFLRRLDRYRITDRPVGQADGMATDSELFAHRIMADRSLVSELSTRVHRILNEHGVTLAADKTYGFVAATYAQPGFAAEARTTRVAAPMVIDSAGHSAVPDWVNPLDGIPPVELLEAVARRVTEPLK